MKLELKWPSGQKTIAAERRGDAAHVTVDGQTYKLTLVERQGSLLTFTYVDAAGRRRWLRVAQSANGADRYAWVDGQHFRYERLETGRSRAHGHPRG